MFDYVQFIEGAAYLGFLFSFLIAMFIDSRGFKYIIKKPTKDGWGIFRGKPSFLGTDDNYLNADGLILKRRVRQIYFTSFALLALAIAL